MKRPSFQFYPGDWQSNSNLKRCTRIEKSVWLDVLCLMHDQEEYGVLRWPLKDIAEAVGCKVAELKALRDKGVLKGADKGEVCPAYVYVPRSGRKEGDPVTLIHEQPGPIWFSSRFVRDEYVRTVRGEGSRFGDSPNDAPKPPNGDGTKASPKPPLGDGSSSSSSSSSSTALTQNQKSNVIAMATQQPDDDFVPRNEGDWLRHLRTKHGFVADESSVHDRKRYWGIFAAWVNSGIRASQLDAAIAKARAEATEPISNIVAYANVILTQQTTPKKPRVEMWWVSNETMSAKAKALGIADARPGEQPTAFKARIQQAIDARETA
jgi:hypothetical protein